ncbi:uncharacterized protein BDV17DRAFT_279302 [Aspergillus undulatus]|uniref:uncharacterized protein n=1 Tax=Aspergillus undulatus TaxID=1810928 RepID=UPI003CCCFDF7
MVNGLEQSLKYKSTAKEHIIQIVPHPSISRNLDPKVVERLSEIFSRDGCRRLDIQNHVTAVVSQQNLTVALQTAGVATNSLKSTPPGEYSLLESSHGEQWWTVDLYLDKINVSSLVAIMGEYSNEKDPSDGECLLKFASTNTKGMLISRNGGMARLSPNKSRRLRQLSSRVDIRAAFDRLVLATNYDERGLFYLSYDRVKILKIDPQTVANLQGRAPGVSFQDAAEVQGLVFSGAVFPDYAPSERKVIYDRLKRRKSIIPSLDSFFQDMWYLEALPYPSIKAAFMHMFKPDHGNRECLIQVSEADFRQHLSTQTDHAELGYRQLWLYTKHHYPKISRQPGADEMVLRGMAVLVPRLGFDSDT